jgi:uncharacterized protein YutE (UPF0331/DUF86 family)
VAFGHVKTLGIRNKLISKLYQLFRVRVTPTAYRMLCLRFACLVRRSLGSATDARLDTGGWLALARQGLSPCKMRRACPGAIADKLESLRRCVARVRARCPATVEQLAFDPDAQDIVALNLTRAVQLCVDVGSHLLAESDAQVPNTMGGVFDALTGAGTIDGDLARRLKKTVGFRNIAIDNYRAIDWQIVFGICQRGLDDFRAFARTVDGLLGA